MSLDGPPPRDGGRASGMPSTESVIHDLLVATATKLMLATAAASSDRSTLVLHAQADLEVLAVWLGGGPGGVVTQRPA